MSSGMDEAVREMHAEDEAQKNRAGEKVENRLIRELSAQRVVSSNRVAKHEYFMGVADAVSTRATCPRRSVGAILVVNSHIVSSGYNGSPRGLPHCIGAGCEIVSGHCVRTVHAEANCLLQAAEHGASTHGATLYTTASPCRNCMNLIINAGVSQIVYADQYADPSHEDAKEEFAGAWALEAAHVLGINMIHAPRPSDPKTEAAKAAAEAIYFNDNSDYLSALWNVVNALDPKAKEHLDANKLPPWMREDDEEGESE